MQEDLQSKVDKKLKTAEEKRDTMQQQKVNELKKSKYVNRSKKRQQSYIVQSY